MSLQIVLLIMLIAGILGGLVNYLLPANQNAETGKKIRQWYHCVILGFGATFLIPLFLEIAQSRLLDDMYIGWSLSAVKSADKPAGNIPAKTDTLLLKITPADTFNKKPAETTIVKRPEPDSRNPKPEKSITSALPDNKSNPLKSYLLYGAYCLLAAAAGFKFINMLINNVVKDKELTEKNNKIEDLEKEKEKRVKNSQMCQQKENQNLSNKIATEKLSDIQFQATATARDLQNISIPFLPVLPPVTHPEDPQKGRFGGNAKNNMREMKAEVKKSNNIPGFFNIKLSVQSTDTLNPLITEVIFYLHDSLYPSVYPIKPIDGKAEDDDIQSYGAFTVGAITDNGQTMLELDLAQDKSFPKEFRER